MRPGRNEEIILEDSRDRRYMRRGALILGNVSLLTNLERSTDRVYQARYNRTYNSVTQSDMSNARMWGIALDHRFTEFKSDNGVRAEIAQREAANALHFADVPLNPSLTEDGLEGLAAVAELSRFDAMRYFVQRPVAEAMIQDFFDR